MFKVHIHDGTKDLPTDPIYYLICKDGIYLKKDLGLISSLTKVDKISILEKIDSFAFMNIPKIEKDLTYKIFSFFKEVYATYKSEAIVLIYYHLDKKKYWVRVPTQEVSTASVDYKNFNNNNGYTFIGTIHSHGSMSACHSSTDVEDERGFDGLHITIGDLDENHPSIVASVVASKYRFVTCPTIYMDGVEKIVEEKNNQDSSVFPTWYSKHRSERIKFKIEDNSGSFPKPWMDLVSKKEFARSHHHPFQSHLPLWEDYSPQDIKSFYEKWTKRIGYSKPTQQRVIGYNEDQEFAPCDMCPHFDAMIDKVLSEYSYENNEEDIYQTMEEDTNG